MKQGMKAFLTTMGVGCCLSAGVIIAAIASGGPKYDKEGHKNAKKMYDIACENYATTHRIIAKEAEISVYTDRDLRPILSEKAILLNKIYNCTDSARRVELLKRSVVLDNEIERHINSKMATDADLIAATDAMNKRLQVVEKYERDSAARADWCAKPVRDRVKTSLRKIFTNENVR